MISTAEDGSIMATLYDPQELTAAVDEYYKNVDTPVSDAPAE